MYGAIELSRVSSNAPAPDQQQQQQQPYPPSAAHLQQSCAMRVGKFAMALLNMAGSAAFGYGTSHYLYGNRETATSFGLCGLSLAAFSTAAWIYLINLTPNDLSTVSATETDETPPQPDVYHLNFDPDLARSGEYEYRRLN